MTRNNKASISLKTTSLKLLRRYVRLLLWLNSIDTPDPYMKMVDKINNLIKHSGKAMAVPYLKKSKLALDFYLSGNPSSHLGHTPRIAISPSGIPLIIPKVLHNLIENEDLGCIRVCQGVLSVFRILPLKGEVNLSTITDPFKGISTTLNWNKVADVWIDLFQPIRGINPNGVKDLLNLKTAGPNHRISILGASADAYCYNKLNRHLLEPYKILSHYFNCDLWKQLDNEILFTSDLEPSKEFKLGKLSTKVEAAGKIRVFAIVDVWTQSLLESIHTHVFSILKDIENDGCFDQEKPLKRLLEKGHMNTWSYDLSAATDRFPIDLQVQVLSCLYTREVADAWRQLLVDRDYFITLDKGNSYIPIRYAVGQPMGALSSWGVFSLSHHFIVQYCARQEGFTTWFDDYALLGDDIVIANESVAKHYHYLMTEVLGVEINLSKSIQSNKGVCEFAKRLVSPTKNYSPVGPKNVLLALKAPSHLSTVILDFIQKGGTVVGQLDKWISSLSWDIVKISKGNLESLIWSVQGPFGFLDSGSRFGPERVETTLHYFKLHGVHLDLTDEINDVVDKAIKQELEETLAKSRIKTKATIDSYRSLLEVPGFKSDTIQQSPAFRSFVLSSFENYMKLEDIDTLELPRSEEFSSVAEIIKYKYDRLPSIFPDENALNPKRIQRPRFRKTSIDFFKRVNQNCDDLFEEFAIVDFGWLEELHQ